MDTFLWILLCHQLIGFISAALALYFSASMLFRKKVLEKSKNFSPLMIINFIYFFVFSFISTIYHIYMFILWRPDQIIYDPRLLFLLGVIPWIFMVINSVIECFLCIERCLAILFPMSFRRSLKLAYIIMAVVTNFTLMGIVVYGNQMIPLFFEISSPTCRYFGCYIKVSTPFMLYVKIVFIILNIIFAIILAILIKCLLNSSNLSAKRINKTVLFMVICTVMIELVPWGTGQVFYAMTGQQIQTFIGPYGYTSVSINIVLNAGVYYSAFKKNFHSPVNTKAVVFTNSVPITISSTGYCS